MATVSPEPNQPSQALPPEAALTQISIGGLASQAQIT